MKALSIIGIVLTSLSIIVFIIILSENFRQSDQSLALWGSIGILYGFAFSIVGLVFSVKRKNFKADNISQLIKLAELKDKGILSEEEFNAQKEKFL